MQRPLTVAEAAKSTGLHRQTIADALRRGDLHGGQRGAGCTWRIREECLDAWLFGEKCSHALAAAAA